MPMANKDGVARGWTRFNVNGMDLNRKWDAPANPVLNPENAALENWLQQQIDKQHRPDLAIDLHNDQSGRLHVSRPNIHLDTYLANAKRLESLMLEHTWFREGATGGSYRNPGSLGEGFLERYGIDGFILELNASWIKGLNDYPSAQHWKLFGNQMLDVFDRYFD